MMVFRDRAHAASLLARHPRLQALRGRSDVLVIGLPRGGIPIAAGVAAALSLPFDMVVPRKIGHPLNEEVAIGALTESGTVLWQRGQERLMSQRSDVLATIAAERAEAQRRAHLYRAGRPALQLRGVMALVVDDGVATGATMRAAVQSLRELGAASVMVAVPVAPADTARELADLVDQLVILSIPRGFTAVGQWYQHWNQVSDEEVIDLMRRETAACAQQATSAASVPAVSAATGRSIKANDREDERKQLEHEPARG